MLVHLIGIGERWKEHNHTLQMCTWLTWDDLGAPGTQQQVVAVQQLDWLVGTSLLSRHTLPDA